MQPAYGQIRLIDANQDGDLDIFGVWQAGIDRAERYVVQLQNDDDGDGLTNGADRCPAFAAATPTGCPPGTLAQARRVKARKSGKKGVRLDLGVSASCPAAGIPCRLRTSVASARPRTRSAASITVAPGKTLRASIKVSRRAAAALRRAGKLRITIRAALTGSDGATSSLVRKATVRAPRR